LETTIILSEDGSHTLYVPSLKENYHSTHGAIAESMHVFILNGLKSISKKEIKILEIGFGTGLNALLSMIEAEKENKRIEYTGIELYPLPMETIQKLNYPQLIKNPNEGVFHLMHTCEWEVPVKITTEFILRKIRTDVCSYQFQGLYDLVYFDAFAPAIQPELWQEKVFFAISNAMSPGAILVTYSARGEVRRTLQKLGLKVERLPGPKGKREMIRANKP
jgi:tRNA U34 5-methylaminomethyl-2-thiouridine-forming methyltransferase MnmC